MFDIPSCVFILAIDYDVVIKGLEKKFGPKTEANEREFRSFFDKIIQVPFSMPLSAYNTDKLIKERFKELGFNIEDNMRDSYNSIVGHTVGTNPRSIKRYINTFSLLNRIKKSKNETTEEENTAGDDFCLFALIGFQIAYPKIYQLLIKDQNFISWDKSFSQRNNIEICIPEEYKSSGKEEELLDEQWEKIIYSYCQKDFYLKARVFSVLSGLNIIRKKIGDDALDLVMSNALQVANITSVDDDKETSHKKFAKIRLEGWDEFYQIQKSNGKAAETLEITKLIHDVVVNLFLDKNPQIIIKYTPNGVITFNADTSRRKKVFVYTATDKKSVWFALPGLDTKEYDFRLNKTKDFSNDLNKLIINSYNAIADSEKKYK